MSRWLASCDLSHSPIIIFSNNFRSWKVTEILSICFLSFKALSSVCQKHFVRNTVQPFIFAKVLFILLADRMGMEPKWTKLFQEISSNTLLIRQAWSKLTISYSQSKVECFDSTTMKKGTWKCTTLHRRQYMTWKKWLSRSTSTADPMIFWLQKPT